MTVSYFLQDIVTISQSISIIKQKGRVNCQDKSHLNLIWWLVGGTGNTWSPVGSKQTPLSSIILKPLLKRLLYNCVVLNIALIVRLRQWPFVPDNGILVLIYCCLKWGKLSHNIICYLTENIKWIWVVIFLLFIKLYNNFK